MSETEVPVNPTLSKLSEKEKLGITLRYYSMAHKIIKSISPDVKLDSSNYLGRLQIYLRKSIQNCAGEYQKEQLAEQSYANQIFLRFNQNIPKQSRLHDIQFDLLSQTFAIGTLQGLRQVDKKLNPLSPEAPEVTQPDDDISSLGMVRGIENEKPLSPEEEAEIFASLTEEEKPARKSKADVGKQKQQAPAISYDAQTVDKCLNGLKLVRAFTIAEVNATKNMEKLFSLSSIRKEPGMGDVVNSGSSAIGKALGKVLAEEDRVMGYNLCDMETGPDIDVVEKYKRAANLEAQLTVSDRITRNVSYLKNHAAKIGPIREEITSIHPPEDPSASGKPRIIAAPPPPKKKGYRF